MKDNLKRLLKCIWFVIWPVMEDHKCVCTGVSEYSELDAGYEYHCAVQNDIDDFNQRGYLSRLKYAFTNLKWVLNEIFPPKKNYNYGSADEYDPFKED